MLDSLHIQNYRLFKDLKIDKLGQVNLIAGKNNTGKTALLEAIKLLLSATDIDNFNNKVSLSIISRGDNDAADMFKTLFNDSNFNIVINNIEITGNRKYNLVVPNEKDDNIIRLSNRTEHLRFDYHAEERANSKFSAVSIDTNGKLNDILWEDIALTPEEDDVVDILKILDSKIRKISVTSGKAKILLSNLSKPIPLKNFGDGANRLLTIALALVSAKNKALLIDEFEVGLHHSVQEQLWDIIFKYAQEWNIQVFVTTHSQDTVEKFFYVTEKEENRGKGVFFTLNRDGENIVALDYDREEIKLALESNIEIR